MTARMHTDIPILAAIGVRVLEARPGFVEVELPFEPNLNHFGAAYAGSLYTAAEVLGGQILRTSLDLDAELAGFVPVLKSSEIRYQRPARGRSRARATMSAEEVQRLRREVLAHGKVEYILESEIVADDDTVVATMSGVYQLRRF